MHGFNWMAGEVMWKRGCSQDEKIYIDDRIECLTRAVNSYSAALKNDNLTGNLSRSRIITPLSSSTANTNRLIHQIPLQPTRDEINQIISQINDRIDVAKLQSRARYTILTSEKHNDESMIEALSDTLINVSVLYNEYAAPLNLFDLCLLILQTCRYNDTSTIITLWKSILCEEILPCRTNNLECQTFLSAMQKGSMSEEDNIILTNDDVADEHGKLLMVFEDGKWASSIKNRVVSLGKELHRKGADYTLPLEFLVESLEGLQRVQMKATGNTTTAWALSTIIEAGASYPSILDAYNSVMRSHDKELNPSLRLTHLLNISEVLMQWVSSALRPSGRGATNKVIGNGMEEENPRIQLIRFSGILLREIDSYKAALESLVGCNNDDIATVYTQFSNAENILRRQIIN